VILGEREIVWAMCGDPVVRRDVDPEIGAAGGEPEHGVGRTGESHATTSHISAVAVIGERDHATDWHEEMGYRCTDLPPDAARYGLQEQRAGACGYRRPGSSRTQTSSGLTRCGPSPSLTYAACPAGL
jgi:hypothetical protein